VNILGGRGLAAEQFPAQDIRAVELKYIRAEFGDAFYQALLQNAGGVYDGFLATFVKPALAYGVYLQVFDRIMYEISSRGVFQLGGKDASAAPSSERLAMKANIADTLGTLLDAMREEVASQKTAGNPLYTIATTSTATSEAEVIMISNPKRNVWL